MRFPRLLLSAPPAAQPTVLAATLAFFSAAGVAAPATPAPRLEQPAVGTTTVSPLPRFHWERLPGTLDHRAPLAYDIEIARDAEFRNVVDGDRVNLARYIADKPLDPGAYHWRVRAVAPDGGPGEWSPASPFTIALLNNFSDGGYPGIHLLPDETIVATTYASLNPQEKPSIVSVRFKMSEVDEMAAKLTPATKR